MPVGFLLALLVPPAALRVAARHALTRGAWDLSRALGRLAPYVWTTQATQELQFAAQAFGLREDGNLGEATALVKARLLEPALPAWSRNVAIDVLISAGCYAAAVGAEPPAAKARNAVEALNLTLIQINLAEADYNVGRWVEAEARLQPLDSACSAFPITRAGLAVQRAWIAAHGGNAEKALDLCASVKAKWLPPTYRAEYHFAKAAALLGAGRGREAEAAMTQAESMLVRLSSRRNALFLRARIAAAGGEWDRAERLCRMAANQAYRAQGGDGLLLWAEALKRLGRHGEAEDALRAVIHRDPESAAASTAAGLLADASATGEVSRRQTDPGSNQTEFD